MSQLVQVTARNPLTRRIQTEVSVRTDKLIEIRDVTKLALTEGARLQQTVAQAFVMNVLDTQQKIDAARRAGQLTPYKEQAIYHYQEAYKYELLSIVEEAHTKVYGVLKRLK